MTLPGAGPQTVAGPSFRTLRPGRISYRSGLDLQQTLLDRRRESGDDVLVLLEHEPVITLGRGTRPGHLLLVPQDLEERGIEVAQVSRGGDATWHGPGQLVGYPIVDLTAYGCDLHRHLRRLEEVLILVLASFGVAGVRVPGKTGVWVGSGKIASIGVAVRRWISWHGFALNVAADLSGFATIVPCGLQGVVMTSLELQTGRPIPLTAVEEQVVEAFAAVFASRHAGEYVPPAHA